MMRGRGMPKANEVFISYSRRNKEFALALQQQLRMAGIDAWLDTEDIPKSAEWWRAIRQGIDGANVFLCVISPDSLTSEVCNWEVAHAIKRHKKIVPLLFRDVFHDGTVPRIQPMIWANPEREPISAAQNWTFLQARNFINIDERNFYQAVPDVIRAIRINLPYVEFHTQLTVRALEWEARRRSASFALRGEGLREAERWLAASPGQDPPPAMMQVEYIRASRQAARARRRVVSVITLLVVMALAAVGVVALYQSLQKEEAEKGRAEQSQIALANKLAVSSGEVLDAQPDLALLLAAQANQFTETAQSRLALLNALNANRYLNAYWQAADTPAEVEYLYTRHALAFSPDGSTLAAGRCLVWDYDTEGGCGQGEIAFLDVNAMQTARDPLPYGGGNLLWTTSGEWLIEYMPHAVVQWNMDNGEYGVLALPSESTAPEGAAVLAISPDGRYAAIGDYDQLSIWDLWDGYTVGGPVTATTGFPLGVAAFSGDGSMLATNDYFDVRVWNVPDVQEIAYLSGVHEWRVQSLAFSRLGRMVASGDERGSVVVWNLSDGTGIKDPEPVYSTRGQLISPPPIYHVGDTGWIDAVGFGGDDTVFASLGKDQNMILWRSSNHWGISYLTGHQAAPWSFAFSPEGRGMASIDYQNDVIMWNIPTETELDEAVDDPNAQLFTDESIEQLIARACRVAGRNMTPAEWAAYVEDETYQSTCPG